MDTQSTRRRRRNVSPKAQRRRLVLLVGLFGLGVAASVFSSFMLKSLRPASAPGGADDDEGPDPRKRGLSEQAEGAGRSAVCAHVRQSRQITSRPPPAQPPDPFCSSKLTPARPHNTRAVPPLPTISECDESEARVADALLGVWGGRAAHHLTHMRKLHPAADGMMAPNTSALLEGMQLATGGCGLQSVSSFCWTGSSGHRPGHTTCKRTCRRGVW